MISVKAEQNILDKLKELLAEENNDNACIRLKEYTIGQACHAKRMLGPSVDEMDELEDEAVEVNGIKFVASETFRDTYGNDFELVFKDGTLMVVPLSA